MKGPIEVKFTYRGRIYTLSPEASMRYRKLAKALGTSVDSLLLDTLAKVTNVGNVLFLPAKCYHL